MRIPVSGLALLGVGCFAEPVESSDLTTGAIRAAFEAQVFENSVDLSVFATFRDGSKTGPYVSLSPQDELSLVDGTGQVHVFDEVDVDATIDLIDNYVGYSANLPLQLDQTLTVSLDRATRRDAVDNTLILPADFELTSPAEEPLSRAEPLVVAWTPSGGDAPVTVRITGSCIATVDESLDDTGTFVVDAGELVLSDEAVEDEVSECLMRVNVGKAVQGRIDPAWGSGEVRGSVQREAVLDTVP